jgi:small subunit ribosomal protein S17e
LIKNTAFDLVQEHGDKFTTDFKHNRDVVKEIVDIEGTVMRNRIAGYITRLKRRDNSS